MKVTFPHMGNLYITIKCLLDELDVSSVIPPYNNKKALELGTLYAPDTACLPLKLNIGNYLQANRMGADTILIAGANGPCRFGYYCEMTDIILKQAGCKMDVIVLEVHGGELKKFMKMIKEVLGGINIIKLVNAVYKTVKVSRLVDFIEDRIFKIRPREVEKGTCDKLFRQFERHIEKAFGAVEIINLLNELNEKLSDVKTDDSKIVLKVGIVGEIYATNDNFANYNIYKKLGQMNVEVSKAVNVSDWIVDHVIKRLFALPGDERYKKYARRYIGAMIGGHAQQTAGKTVMFARDGFDGVIQILPFGCMPEIAAKSVMPEIEKDYSIPVLKLITDELSGEAGFNTRLEAFVDCISKRREEKKDEAELLSWSRCGFGEYKSCFNR